MTPEEVTLIQDHIKACKTISAEIGFAIVGALAQKGVINPLDVAAWADLGAVERQPVDYPPAVRAQVTRELTEFAKALRAAATMPGAAGRA